MKRSLFILLALLALVSCNKENEKDYAQLAIGKWICTQIDGKDIITNKMFYMELKKDGEQLYAQSYAINDGVNGQAQWMESDDYTYTIINNIITVTGKNPLDLSTRLVTEIQSVDETNLSYKVKSLTIDGTAIEDNSVYSFKKVNNQDASLMEGIWCGSSFDEKHYWQYYKDGSFDYYCYDSITGKYLPKEDNNGQYFVYGDFMASNFTNNYDSQEKGTFNECWNFSIDEDTIHFRATRATDTELTAYDVTRVANVGD